MTQTKKNSSEKKVAGLGALTLGALGVVYGDIGTSPLYAVNEIFYGRTHLSPTTLHVIGLISVVLWALIAVVLLKYVTFVLRADNDGEGGVFALLALLKSTKTKVTASFCVVLLFAAGLLFGDGIITPAISVLSAIEGLKVATPSLTPYIIPITIAILTGLFLVQQKGTAVIGKFFGPIILVWFAVIASFGVMQIVQEPQILLAINPMYAIRFIVEAHPIELLHTLGSVMLVITGGEALYADLGHFGIKPIRLSWTTVVLPCLALNYMGQGAFILSGHEVIGDNLFFSLVPEAVIYPTVILAAMATVIASQALISGVFSLASQGIALGYLPRFRKTQTHEHHAGQVYLGAINWALYAGCIALVLTFKSSANLASAYGLAVSIDMLITSIAMVLVARHLWKWSFVKALGLFLPFAVIDALFLSANSLKLFSGGWVPLTVGLIMFMVMTTWDWGRKHIRSHLRSHQDISINELIAKRQSMHNATKSNLLVLTDSFPGDASDPVPPLVGVYLKKFRNIPQHLIMLTVRQTKHPYVHENERYDIKVFENDPMSDHSIIAVRASYGFNELPDVEAAIQYLADRNDLTPNDTLSDWVVYVARAQVVSSHKTRTNLATRLRVALFTFMDRNSTPMYDYFGLGNDKRLTVEMMNVKVQSLLARGEV